MPNNLVEFGLTMGGSLLALVIVVACLTWTAHKDRLSLKSF